MDRQQDLLLFDRFELRTRSKAPIMYGILNLLLMLFLKVMTEKFYYVFPVVLLTSQSLFTLLWLSYFRWRGYLTVPRLYDFQRAKHLLYPSLLYYSYLFFSLWYIYEEYLPQYYMYKAWVPFGYLVMRQAMRKPGERFTAGYITPNRISSLCLVMICTAGMLSAYFDQGIDTRSMSNGVFGACLHIAALVFMEKAIVEHNIAPIEAVYYNAIHAFIFFLAIDLFNDEIVDSFLYVKNSWFTSGYMFWVTLMATIAVPGFMTVTMFQCMSHQTTINMCVSGCIKMMFHPFIGDAVGLYFISDPNPTFLNYVGVIIGVIAAVFYAAAWRLGNGSTRNRVIDVDKRKLMQC